METPFTVIYHVAIQIVKLVITHAVSSLEPLPPLRPTTKHDVQYPRVSVNQVDVMFLFKHGRVH
jgi:hypothetical protein